MKTRYILSFASLIILLPSCTKILNDFEFEDKDPKIVVQARFNPDSTVRVLVTRSLDMFDRREIKVLSAAKVTLFAGEQNLTTFHNDSAGWYSIPAGQITPGNSYRLEVEAEGYPTATSEFDVPVVPAIARIDTSTIREASGPYSSGPMVRGRCTLHFNDNPDTEDYYMIWVKSLVDQVRYDDYGEISDTTHELMYTNISSSSPYLQLAYDEYSGYVKTDVDFNFYMKKLIFSDKLFNGQQGATIDIQFYPEYNYGLEYSELTEKYLDVYFSAVDKHFFEYARTKADMTNADGNPLSEPVTPYSPVVDGYGMVYSESVTKTAVNITGLFSEEDYNYYGGYYEYY